MTFDPHLPVPAERRSFASPEDLPPMSREDDQRYRENIASIRESLDEIAALARFMRKWTALFLAADIAGAPTVSHLVQQLPPIPSASPQKATTP